MTPSPSQILQAARNHHRPLVTRGSRIRAALEHAQASPALVEAIRLVQLVQSLQP